MSTLKETFTSIADAIREKDGSTGKIKPSDMPDKIKNIPSGSGDSIKPFFDAFPDKGYYFYSYNGYKINELQKNDTSNVYNMDHMFAESIDLTSIPELDTSKVENMSSMFFQCRKLTSVSLSNTSKVYKMERMFYDCNKLTSVSKLDASSATTMEYMFVNCYNLTSVSLSNTSKVKRMSSAFSGCSKLTSVSELDVSSVEDMSYIFDDCTSLTSINMINISTSLNIYDTALEHDALVKLISNLKTVTSTRTLTMGSTKLALLSDEEKKVATDKGWVLT